MHRGQLRESGMSENPPSNPWVYRFGNGEAEGSAAMKRLLGGKGANLAEMSRLGLPVPPGFTITTAVCGHYYEYGRRYPNGVSEAVEAALAFIERCVGARFGDPTNPLLVSVRSGAPVSMPGMMDTVLNLGLNDATARGLAEHSGDARFAYDSYRRFLQMFGNVVLGVDHHEFEDILEMYKNDVGARLDTDLAAENWLTVIDRYKAMMGDRLGEPFPQDVNDQLWRSIGAVFGSWRNQRATTYRLLHGIADDLGTAVTVQAMVFGNMGSDCATGVAFTRNPSTGENRLYGEFLINAQGEDVVAGIRTPQPISIEGRQAGDSPLPSMEEAMPEAFAELMRLRERLETHYRDMQDLEFTVQRGRLFMLQTRSGKRTARAALRIAVDMAQSGMITEDEAVLRLDPAALDQLLHPTLDPTAEKHVMARGLPASPGAASGKVAFSADEAEILAGRGEAVILCRVETSPEDIHGMHAARGILTTRGGMTSHAAVVARGMGRACVSGAGELRIDYRSQTMTAAGIQVRAGDIITIDGSSGEVLLGAVPTIQPEMSGDFATVMAWADRTRRMRVRANAETPHDAKTARDFGAEGIGLCRTEHMFFEADRIVAVRRMIMAETEAERRRALAEIEPIQRKDFAELFTIMAGLPVTIRLLDPPLHEFLPSSDEELAQVADASGSEPLKVRQRALRLKESNPMLGHRGCRLGITFPEIYEMQARAIFLAVLDVAECTGQPVIPEIMIPLVGARRELEILKGVIDSVATEISKTREHALHYLVGTMIELPRAALRAEDIAAVADFFSFGTNDLTQTTFGISRDDSSAFLSDYQRAGILPADPFVTLDQKGVGELLSIAVERGRRGRPSLKLGICGEHGGDPDSIAFCDGLTLDYVSCSPFRVPIARLSAAQASLRAATAESE